MNRDTPECTCATLQAADLDADLPHVSPATGVIMTYCADASCPPGVSEKHQQRFS